MTQQNVDDYDSVIAGIAEQLHVVLSGSPQGIYIYLDDEHKVCNERFAEMLGYSSPADWDRPVPFTEQYVVEESHHALVSTYMHAMQHQAAASIDVTWKTLGGEPVPSSVLLVPIAYGGELMALHFVTPH